MNYFDARLWHYWILLHISLTKVYFILKNPLAGPFPPRLKYEHVITAKLNRCGTSTHTISQGENGFVSAKEVQLISPSFVHDISKDLEKWSMGWGDAAHHRSRFSGDKGEKICRRCFPREARRRRQMWKMRQIVDSIGGGRRNIPCCLSVQRGAGGSSSQLHFRLSRLD